MIVVGMISGTSMDGLDVAVADLSGAQTGDLVLRPLQARTWRWPESLRERLLALLPPATTTVAEVAQLDELVGRSCAAAATAVVADVGGADLVVSHGQTVFHWVADGRAEGTLQLGQPAPIVQATGLPVVSDLRARDIAAGGQGAPLAGTLDTLLLRGLPGSGTRAALNLGGIANVTVVPPDDEPVAFDTGPANCLLDSAVTRISRGESSYDAGGAIAAAGTVREDLLDLLLAEPYYDLPAPKSTGRELFTSTHVDPYVAKLAPVADADLVATLVELTARTVGRALAPYDVDRLVVSGGGVHNPVLMAALERALGRVEVKTSDAVGLPADDKEAYLMALIGYLTWHQVPGVLPGMTGADEPRVLGRISLGDNPVHLPEPGVSPRTLTIGPPPVE
ncbi:anhydro-N-acetylmuramic acid kinase [Luteipulveratus sp. YIM 133132]|uniref:anhydro-N-acetylmuramic acid kinase n=1 Tax=Luteipulveratus flavus TaxID=3031728 RepID=UPI0023B128DF|nr:anhydro-N-acetylmuramic acid kinase [Luteipulveratus sp. YIM 133132]MDE9366544.1 anhydro-N-acetylmuramic acid kinase [Luteipulveratus sp. YIM 133132]